MANKATWRFHITIQIIGGGQYQYDGVTTGPETASNAQLQDEAVKAIKPKVPNGMRFIVTDFLAAKVS